MEDVYAILCKMDTLTKYVMEVRSPPLIGQDSGRYAPDPPYWQPAIPLEMAASSPRTRVAGNNGNRSPM